MSNYVEGLGWLTERETRWWNDDESFLYEPPTAMDDWHPTRVSYGKAVHNGEDVLVMVDATERRLDRRWNRRARFTASDVGGPHIGWPIRGREILPNFPHGQ